MNEMDLPRTGVIPTMGCMPPKSHGWRMCSGVVGILCLFFFFSFLSAWAQDRKNVNRHILCTVFPVFTLVSDLTGGTECLVDLLLPTQLGCPHHYTMTPGDLRRVGDADALIFLGLGFEPFAEKLSRDFPNKFRFDAASGTPFLMSADSNFPNPHPFASIGGLKSLVKNLEGMLEERCDQISNEGDTKSVVSGNAKTLHARLETEASAWASLSAHLASLPVVITHESLDYPVADAGLRVVLRFSFDADEGQEPSAGELLAYKKQIETEKPRAILVDTQHPNSVAQILSRETGVPILNLDVMAQGPSQPPFGYCIEVLRKNREALMTLIAPSK